MMSREEAERKLGIIFRMTGNAVRGIRQSPSKGEKINSARMDVNWYEPSPDRPGPREAVLDLSDLDITVSLVELREVAVLFGTEDIHVEFEEATADYSELTPGNPAKFKLVIKNHTVG